MSRLPIDPLELIGAAIPKRSWYRGVRNPTDTGQPWYTSDPEIASGFAENPDIFNTRGQAAPTVYKEHLDTTDALELDAEGGDKMQLLQRLRLLNDYNVSAADLDTAFNRLIEQTKAAGHRGIVIKNVKDRYPNQDYENVRPSDIAMMF